MASNVPVPYFPSPPTQYDHQYMAQVIRAFAVFAQQVNNPGPLRGTTLTLNPQGQKIEAGTMSYDAFEQTIDITMGNNVIQHIGLDTFMRCKNNSGATIPKGRAVGFTGVSGDEVLIDQFVADGDPLPELYYIGVTAFDMADQQVGPVQVYGRLHDIDTTGSYAGQTWAVGDILYVSPTTLGQLTKVRPTAPDAVIVAAAVLKVGTTDGQLMVRTTLPFGLRYGTFSDTTDQTLAAINTATPVKLNTTDIASGVSVVNDGSGNPTRITVADSGFYQVSVSNQYTSTNASSKDVQTWLRKNGTDVANSNSYVTLTGNNENLIFASTYTLSLQANEYFQIMWASNDTTVSINSIAATGYSPASPSVIVTVTQVQL